MKYRLADPVIDEAQIDLIKEVLLSKQLVHGEKCELFEERLSTYLGVDKNSVAVTSSCTASLHLALMTLGIKCGDGVIVPNFTFPATVNVVEQIGATPIFVDVEPEFYTMDSSALEETIKLWKEKISLKAIIVVHEFGAVANLKEISGIAKKYGLYLIEDAACAFGSSYDGHKVGLLSDIGCFSFHPRKALTTGEGGAFVSKNTIFVDQAKILRNHGMQLTDHGIDFVAPGLNYRMTNFQAAMGVSQLDKFDSWIIQRNILQQAYRRLITTALVTHPKEQLGHSWQSYMLVLSDSIDRDVVIKKLREKGIESNYGAYAVLSTQFYKDKYGTEYLEGLPISEKLYNKGICLPLHQKITIEDICDISEVFEDILNQSEV